ncbi:MAG TPA: DUF1343 domain-containing protein [Deltaproteobacteria bacterium]|nr:DUF1343 domain-containing protein [Deltaproteobacteria bacterium]
MVKLGAENLLREKPHWFKKAKIGLLVNQASILGDYSHVKDVLLKEGAQIKVIFTPQHGFWGDKQANMDESPDDVDPSTEVPIISLYSERREPPEELMEKIDILLVDLQDVGTRVYTFASTVALCMKVASKTSTRIVVLDRPNPIGGEAVEGNVLNLEFESFVGLFPVPMRHGLTLGELMLMARREFGYDCDLEVIPLKGWRREFLFPDCELPWVLPSPNMPSFITSLVYPGQVIWEGTNISEGRGTTRPFEFMGAPFINPGRLKEKLNEVNLPGVFLRVTAFRPTFDKWAGELCRGFQLHVTDSKSFKPYFTSLALLWAILEVYGEIFEWLPPPYEYEYRKLPIDIILGDDSVRLALESGTHPEDIENDWQKQLDDYMDIRENTMMYV